MSQKHVNGLTFSRIETTAELRGAKVTSYYSYPEPVGIQEYRRIDDALVRAFGSLGSRTVGVLSVDKSVIVSGDPPLR